MPFSMLLKNETEFKKHENASESGWYCGDYPEGHSSGGD